MNRRLNTKFVKSLSATGERQRVWDTEITGFNLRVTPKGKKVYILTYRHNAILREFTIGQHGNITADEARIIAKKQSGLIADGLDVQAKRIKDKSELKVEKESTLKAFIDGRYEEWASSRLKSWKMSKQTVKRDFKHLLSRSIADITQWDMQKWSSEASKKELKPSTINRRVAIIKGIVSKAHEWGIINENVLRGMKAIKVDNKVRVRYLTECEENQLRNNLDIRQDRQRLERSNHIEWCKVRSIKTPPELEGKFTDYLMPMVLLVINTGMRRGELFDLYWKDVDFKTKIVTIEGLTAKNGKTRHLPMNEEAFSLLLSWRNESESTGLVFPSPVSGKRLNNIKRSWGGVIEMAKIKNFRFHDLRHHFASQLVMAGVDLNTVRELLGHSDISTTLRYAHLAPEHKAAAVAMLIKNKS